MPSIKEHIAAIRATIPDHVTLVCVSKFHPIEAIQEAYDAGERDFGESRVQELCAKYQALPKDIRWHFIGHLQTNKVRAIIPFVHLIQSVDSLHLLQTIEHEAARINRVVDVLLEVHVAQETTKSGLLPQELPSLLASTHPHVRIQGFMGMATNTDDTTEIRRCFRTLRTLLTSASNGESLGVSLPTLSMGMSDDYPIAIEEGSNLVRIGSSIFGERM